VLWSYALKLSANVDLELALAVAQRLGHHNMIAIIEEKLTKESVQPKLMRLKVKIEVGRN
jgi:hypothetical protein